MIGSVNRRRRSRSLREQLEIEGQLVGLYEEYERGSENKAMKRVMQMFKLDSQRHINIIQAAIELLEGQDIFIEDKEPLKDSLRRHLDLEAEALKRANSVLGKQWVDENRGLKELLQIRRDDEKRHQAALKDLSGMTYFRLTSNDMVALFRDEAFLEERYRRSKQFREKKSQTG
jgi:hypothetical protein